MKYSYLWLKEYVLQMPEPKKLVELLTMRAFEVEEVDMVGKDTVLDIKVLPNRAFDCLSHIGMAREIAAICNIKCQISNIKYNEDKDLKIKDFLSIDIQDKKLCPRYSARVVVDVEVKESPIWLKDKLIACGLRPINNIVDITNYVLLETGQPMHAFDLGKINGSKIIVRSAKKGESITTLEGEERELNENILVIADEKDPIAIAGIKGGKKAEIDNKTTRIILESANFEPISTRKSSKALNLRTDASIRFENGLDINLTIEALNKAAGMIAELASGKIVSGIADAQAIKPQIISTAAGHSYIESLLGIKIKQKEVLDIFKRLDLPVKIIKKKEDVFYEVFVPSRRNDLNTSEDLIEEIGRLYGYENIQAVMPTSILIPAVKNEELINEEKARNIMVGAGYSEVYNYSLISEKDKELFGFKMAGPRHPLSGDQKYLRSTLIIRLLENIKENLKYFEQVRIFEIGKVFRVKEKSIQEKRMLAGVLCGGKGGKNIFYEAKGAIDLLMEKMGVANFGYTEYSDSGQKSPPTPLLQRGEPCKKAAIFDAAKRAKVMAGDKEIGWAGKINKSILLEMGINEPVAVFELDFDMINELIEEEIEYQAPSKYPAIERDLSIIAPQEVKVDDILNIIGNSSGPLVIDIALLDIYEPSFTVSQKLRTGKSKEEEEEEILKSLTFRLVFQSYEKTLTDAEVNKIIEKVIKSAEEEGWEIRK